MRDGQEKYLEEAEPASEPARLAPRDRVEIVRGAGRWMPWAGLGLAVIWWACVAGALITVFDLTLIARQPPITLAVGALFALLPGLLILMASFMARESARGAAANALVLQAAHELLDPADAVAMRTESLARRVSASAEEVDRAMGHAFSAMKALSGEIGDERLRLESVSYAAADNARELAERLSGERAALEALIGELRGQADTLNEAIPRQARAMVDATRQAGEEVARAEAALEQRLAAMRENAAALGGEIGKLEGLAGSANEQSEQVLFAVSRVEEKIDQSRRTVDDAIRASESAAAAATSTAEALHTAVNAALEDARRASGEISARTRAASEDAARQMAHLREAAEQANTSIKAAANAARAEADMTERRLGQVTGAMARRAASPPVDRPARAAPPSLPAPAPPVSADTSGPAERAEPPSQPSAAPSPKPAPEIRAAQPPPVQPPRPAVRAQGAPDTTLFAAPPGPDLRRSEAPARAVEDDLFEAGANGHLAGEPHAETRAAEPGAAPPAFDPLEEAETAPAPSNGEAKPPVNGHAPPPARSATGWSHIINDMERTDAGELPREETAEQVIRRLEGSGIALASIFRPRDKKKIASAARKGERPRRTAIVSAARGEVDRVVKRLRADGDLEKLARDFVSMEAPDAIAALDRTQRSNRNASPRLSAFLLLDAAMDDRPGA